MFRETIKTDEKNQTIKKINNSNEIFKRVKNLINECLSK